jgi:hypothetical protein
VFCVWFVVVFRQQQQQQQQLHDELSEQLRRLVRVPFRSILDMGKDFGDNTPKVLYQTWMVLRGRIVKAKSIRHCRMPVGIRRNTRPKRVSG